MRLILTIIFCLSVFTNSFANSSPFYATFPPSGPTAGSSSPAYTPDTNIPNTSGIQNEGKKTCAEKEICVEITQRNERVYILTVKNNTPYIASVVLKLNNVDNIANKRLFPLKMTVHGKKKKAKNILIKNPKNKISFKFAYQWVHGNFKAFNNVHTYALPYKLEESYVVGQGMDTDKTHKGNHKYAVDWNMDEGTSITAARSGYAIEMTDKFTTNGNSPQFLNKANYVKLLHNDGTSSLYAHLKPSGVAVKKDQFVKKGQLIGYSGNTGYSTGPHLHFHVSKPVFENGSIIEKTIPFKLKNCQFPSSFKPVAGVKYKSC